MNITNKKQFAKSIAGITLSLCILLSGSMVVNTPSVHAASVSSSSLASNIIATGNKFLAVPYRFGSKTGNTSSFDCSSFTQYVYKLNGVSIPRSSKQQSQAGTFVPRSQLQPGDLIFFYSPIHHVAIYMGNGKLLHTFGSQGVTVTDLNSGWWNSHYTTARRVLPDSGQAVAVPTPVPADSYTSTTPANHPEGSDPSTTPSYQPVKHSKTNSHERSQHSAKKESRESHQHDGE